jgi:hypothetical protein
LRQRKNTLVEFLLDARLDQQTYDEPLQRMNAEMEAAKDELTGGRP